MSKEINKNRYDFVFYLDVENGNPNGDPDMDNMPRTDAETGHGLITSVCIKRKIRNYVELVKQDEPGMKIFIKEALNPKIEAGYDAANSENPKADDKTKIANANKYMCDNYFDIRAFGGVLSTGKKQAGTVWGPVQISYGKSVDPVFPQEVTISRMAITDEKDDRKNVSGGTLGKQYIIPYGLYRIEGHIEGAFNRTGFTEEDVDLLFEAIENMLEHDYSAARGKMAVRKLIVFKHETGLGNNHSHLLLERVSAKRKDETKPARSFSDYDISINLENLPENITVNEII